MNHLEALTKEWLEYPGYFCRTTVRVGKRAKGGWDGELDVVGFHPDRKHFLHVECSLDAWSWEKRQKTFSKKFEIGRQYATDFFRGLEVEDELDQVVLHGYASAPEKHRSIGSGRLLTVSELFAEILSVLPRKFAKAAVPENYPLIRTLQLAKSVTDDVTVPEHQMIPR